MNQSQVLSSEQHSLNNISQFTYGRIESFWNKRMFNPLVANNCYEIPDHFYNQMALFCKLYQVPEIIYSRCVITNVFKVQKITLIKTHSGIVDTQGNVYAIIRLTILDSGEIRFMLHIHPSLMNYTGENDIAKLIGFFKLMYMQSSEDELIKYDYDTILQFNIMSHIKEKNIISKKTANKDTYLNTPNILRIKQAESKLNGYFRHNIIAIEESFSKLFVQE